MWEIYLLGCKFVQIKVELKEFRILIHTFSALVSATPGNEFNATEVGGKEKEKMSK